MMILLMVLLVVLPYGTALICGALSIGPARLYRAGAASAASRSVFISSINAWSFLWRPDGSSRLDRRNPTFLSPELDSETNVAKYRRCL
jgi:hypothetical protein